MTKSISISPSGNVLADGRVMDIDISVENARELELRLSRCQAPLAHVDLIRKAVNLRKSIVKGLDCFKEKGATLIKVVIADQENELDSTIVAKEETAEQFLFSLLALTDSQVNNLFTTAEKF